jgi:Holliday junction resolvase
MRRRGRTDANQKEIVKVFRKLGFSVAITSMVGSGFPDIVIGKHKWNWLVEIKDGKKVLSERDLTDDEKKFISEWKGSVYIVETVEQAIALGALLDKENLLWDMKA